MQQLDIRIQGQCEWGIGDFTELNVFKSSDILIRIGGRNAMSKYCLKLERWVERRQIVCRKSGYYYRTVYGYKKFKTTEWADSS